MKLKRCAFCEKVKAMRYFGKNKPYCLSCFRLYMKHMRCGKMACHSEREMLMQYQYFHNKKNRDALRNIISNPVALKKFRKLLRNYDNGKRHETRMMLERFN